MSTEVAIEFDPPYGAIIKDRSSMAVKGVKTSTGVIDAGDRGEMNVVLTLDLDTPPSKEGYEVKGYRLNEGDKIAQFVPVRPMTIFEVKDSEVQSDAKRGAKGWGSSGK